MITKKISPAKLLRGEASMPGDKSISHRAVILGAISEAETVVKDVLDCDDCNFTISAFRGLGVAISKKGALTFIQGRGFKGLKKPSGPINVGNSGTSMRLLAGVLAGQDFESVLEGDASLAKRPMKRIIEPLSLMGADIRAVEGEFPPLKIKGGKLHPIDYRMKVASAQVKSAILLAALCADGTTTVEEICKSRDHTERMIRYFGAGIKVNGLKVVLEGPAHLKGKELEVPGDISSAGFFIAGATILKGSKIRINNISMNPTRTGIIEILSRMGAKIRVIARQDLFESAGDVEVESALTKGIVIGEEMIPGVIDELPILFVVAALSEGRTIIKGAGELKVKETDRILSMKANLEKMGAKVGMENGTVVIDGIARLEGADLKSFGDHRTCMAMTIAALVARGASSIDDAGCVSKSFPGFFRTLEELV